MLRSTGVLVLFSLLSQALSLGLQVALAHRFGVGAEVDAYIVAMTLPGLLDAFVLAAVTQLLLPVLVRRFDNDEREDAWRVISTLLTLLCGGLLMLALPVALAREGVVKAMAPSLSGPALEMASSYVAVLFPGLSLGVAAALLTQVYHAERRFGVPALIGALSQVIPLTAVITFAQPFGMWSLIVGTLIAKAVVLIPLSMILVRRGAVLRPRLELHHPEVRRMAWLALPAVTAVASARLNGAVDRFFVSFLGTGKIAALGYADRVVSVVLALLVSPVTSVLYPALAGYEARQDRRGLFRAVDRGVRAVMAGMIPVTVGIVILASPFLRMLFEHGRFSSTDTSRVAAILACYAGILILGGVGSLLVRGFYAIGNTRDPMIWGGILPLVANAVMDLLVYRRFGVYGVAAVTSINAMIGLPVLYVVLRRRLGADPIGGWPSFFLRATTAGVLMASVTSSAASWLLHGGASLGALITLLLAAGAGLASYLAAALLLRLEPIPELVSRCLVTLRTRVVAQSEVLR
jgi:putative peptidoglycan lipid II flippase